MRVIFSLSLLSSLSLAGVLFGQSGPSLKTHSNVGIFVADQNSASLHSSLAGTLIKDPLNQQVNTRTGVTASSQISLRVTNGFSVVTVSDRGAVDSKNPKARASFGTTASLHSTGIRQGPTSVLLTIPLLQGSRGTVRVRYSGKLVGGATAHARVDIGNDGKFEFSQKAGAQVEKDLPVQAGPKGIQVLIETNASGKVSGVGAASYEAGLVVIFIPKPGCTFTSYGKSCGPVLKGVTKSTPGGPIVFLDLSNAAKSSPVGLLLGIRKTNLRIPGTNCLVLNHPILFFAFHTNQQGTARMVLGGGPIEPFHFLAQALVLDRRTLQFTSTNGLEAVCR